MTMEQKIRNNLLKRGFSNAEASREAFGYVTAWMNGEVEPETITSLLEDPSGKNFQKP